MIKHCDKHDKNYESTVKIVGDKEVELGMCPVCAEEIHAAFVEQGKRDDAVELQLYRLEKKQGEQAKRFDRAGIPPRFRSRSFENYQAEERGQSEALRRAKAYAERICAGGYGGLILSGEPGTGKTHLACAISIAYEQTGKTVLFLTVAELIWKLRESYGPNPEMKLLEAIKQFRDIDLLVIDEVGVQTGSDDEVILLVNLLNARYGWMKPTVMISNLDVPGMEVYLSSRVIDRMREDGGALIEFKWESFRTKAAMVHSA